MNYYIGISKAFGFYEDILLSEEEDKEEFISKVSKKLAEDLYNSPAEDYTFAIRFIDLSEDEVNDFENNFSKTDLANTESVYYMTVDYFYDHGDNCHVGYDYITLDDIPAITEAYIVKNPFTTQPDIAGSAELFEKAMYSYLEDRLSGDKIFKL